MCAFRPVAGNEKIDKMMERLNMTTKIWLSVGIFVLGYLISTAFGQVQGLETRASLRITSEALFPAAQHSQEAEAAFEKMVKGFGDSVVMQDASAMDRAVEDGRQTVAALKSVAAIQGLAPARMEETRRLANSLEQTVDDARTTYQAVLGGTLTADTQEKMRSIAARTDAAKVALTKAKQQFAADLRERLGAIEAQSSRQNNLAMGIFVLTMVVAGGLVHFTIQRSITGPVVRVIGGVQDAADQTVKTSAELSQSGRDVSHSAQEQAAFIQETSATLEEISATTRQNADRAKDADTMMQSARQTGDRAKIAMQELSSSMDSISKSSKQVASVLKTIDEIAFHTNILALNAAVEAARAGEAGAGFSVVADEVRSLAHRAAEAARNSGSIVEQTVRDIGKGVVLVGNAHAAFEEVTNKIANGSQLVSQIAASNGEQATGIGMVGQAIQKMELLTRRNVVNAQRTADGVSAMAEQVESTRKYLGELLSMVGSGNA